MNDCTVLHINNSYGGTRVYYNLYYQLDRLGLIQYIFIPLNSKNHSRIGNQQIDFKNKSSSIQYSTDLRFRHKYLYSAKINTVVNAIEKSDYDFTKIQLIHASNLCLDGAAAYYLWLKYKIPYIVTIRNTDINLYYKKLVWKRSFFHQILRQSSRIIFISPAYKEKFLNEILNKRISNAICKKAAAIPNGVDNTFLEGRRYKNTINAPIKVLYAGGIQKNKNIHSSIKALERIRNSGFDITYTIIGKGLKYRKYNRKYLKKIEYYAKKHDWIDILPSQEMSQLRESYSYYDIFLMPSFQETFGLSYIEALTQGLPLIYSQGQGFDGFFKYGDVGFPIIPDSVKDIEQKLLLLIENYAKITENIKTTDLKSFNWENIANEYKNIYFELIKMQT